MYLYYLYLYTVKKKICEIYKKAGWQTFTLKKK